MNADAARGETAGRPVWAADVEIDTALAAQLVLSQFPELRGEVAAFGVGWDNAAFLVGGRIVFRFPRRRVSARLIERECAILPRIAASLPLSIPVPRFIGQPSDAYPWTFAGYERIDGVTACSVWMSEAKRARLAQPLGRFLRALHEIDTGPLLPLGLGPDEIGRLVHERCIAATRERLRVLVAAGVEDVDLLYAWLASHPPVPIDGPSRRLVHGDLYARHVMIGEKAHLTGVIDWGDVHHGDPALDLAVAHLLLPASAHVTFRDAYGPIDERTWEAARFRAVYHALLEIHYAYRENDGDLLRAGASSLDFLRPLLFGVPA